MRVVGKWGSSSTAASWHSCRARGGCYGSRSLWNRQIELLGDAGAPHPPGAQLVAGTKCLGNVGRAPRVSTAQGDVPACPFPSLQVNIRLWCLCPWAAWCHLHVPFSHQALEGTGGAFWLPLAPGSAGRCRVCPWEGSCPWASLLMGAHPCGSVPTSLCQLARAGVSGALPGLGVPPRWFPTQLAVLLWQMIPHVPCPGSCGQDEHCCGAEGAAGACAMALLASHPCQPFLCLHLHRDAATAHSLCLFPSQPASWDLAAYGCSPS